MASEVWSAVAGVASAIAASVSLFITWRGLVYQKASLIESRRRNIQDMLSYQAERANSSCSGKTSSDWSFSEFANIMFAIDTARNMVTRIKESDGISREEAGTYFLDLLNQHIVATFKHGTPPDGAFKNKGSIPESLEVIQLWNPNAHFLGFTDVNFGIS